MIKCDIAEEEKIYREFKSLARELKTPVLDMHYSLELMLNDVLIDKIGRTRSHSFNRNAFNWMFTDLAAHPYPDTSFGASYVSVKDTGGTIRSNSTQALSDTSNGYVAEVTNDDNGIVIGTGSAAESFDGYQLTTKVIHGNAAGQMHYSDSEISYAWSVGDLTFTSTLIRYFNNNSGGTIVVTEIGLYAGLSYDIMVNRDLLGSSISCVDASQLKVTYEVELVYPE